MPAEARLNQVALATSKFTFLLQSIGFSDR